MKTTASPLLVPLGDPNGLGPELACRLFGTDAGRAEYSPQAPLLLLGAAQPLQLHLKRLGLKPFWEPLSRPEQITGKNAGVYFFEIPECKGFTATPGQATQQGGAVAGQTLEFAIRLCLEGAASGMVTLPLHKGMLQQAGFPFSGHTEFLARRCNLRDEDVCMHLCGSVLRVSLVTTHPPLSKVPQLVTRERIVRYLWLTDELLQALELPRRAVGVCGLNPHAGEGGTIGHEEIAEIIPAVREAQAAGLDVHGPLPGDSIFHRAVLGEFDAVLAMYHDQGLAPLKLLHFNKAVNVTLGLPFVRTSVDHGTGFDLVGRDTAATSSLVAALQLGQRLVISTK